MNNRLHYKEEIDVAHICLFEEKTGRVLIQHNNKFNASAFIWGKCDGKNQVDTIVDEMWDEIWYSLLPDAFVEVIQNTREVGWKICKGTIFAWILPQGFEPVDVRWEWESKFYKLWDAPLDNFITWDVREETVKIIKKCHSAILSFL